MQDDRPPTDFSRTSVNVAARATKSAILLTATTMLLRSTQLLTTIVLARILSPADYGVVAIAMMVVVLLDILSNIQVGGAIIRSADVNDAYLDSAFTLTLLRGLITAAALCALARPTAIYFQNDALEPVLYVLSISALITGFENPHFVLFARNLDFMREARRDGLAAVFGSVVGIVAALVFRSYWALVASSIATAFAKTAFSYFQVQGRPKVSLRYARNLLSFGSWIVLINVINYVNNRVDYLIIGRFLGDKVLGAYHIGQQITAMATGDIVLPLGRALLPAFSMIMLDKERLRAAYRQFQAVTLAISLPVGFGVSGLADNLVYLLVGTKWDLAVPVITILAPLIALHSMDAGVESLALSLNKGRALFIRAAIFFVLRVGAIIVGFYYGGFLGVIYARIFSGLCSLAMQLILAAYLTESRIIDPLIASWRSVVSVVVMWLVIRSVGPSDYAPLDTVMLAVWAGARILLGASVYCGVHFALWALVGKPAGPELRFLDLGRKLVGRLAIRRRLG